MHSSNQTTAEPTRQKTAPQEAEPDNKAVSTGKRVPMRQRAASASPKGLDQLMKEVADYACLQGSKGESDDHKALKKWVRENPVRFGLADDSMVHEEFRFPSGDRADVVFKGTGTTAVVEAELTDFRSLLSGLFQVVKYKALMEAVKELSDDSFTVVGLLVAKKIPRRIREYADRLHVTVYEITDPS